MARNVVTYYITTRKQKKVLQYVVCAGVARGRSNRQIPSGLCLIVIISHKIAQDERGGGVTSDTSEGF